MKVLFVCTEVAPFSAVGGLAQAAYFLPRALKKLGVDISIFTPKYGTVDEKFYKLKPYVTGLRVPTGEKTSATRELLCNVKVREGTKREPTIYFLENREYYEQRANVYGYSDDHIRFALLSRGVLEFIRHTGEKPMILHCNDWHTGYIPNYLRHQYEDEKIMQTISTVFTIHNMRQQGMFDFRFASPLNFDDGKSPLGTFFSDMLKKQNALKRGIIYSDLVNTVSEQYSREIMTPQYGEGLDQLMQEVRTKVFGVLNGLDNSEFDPSSDKLIEQNYSWRTLAARKKNRVDLQESFGLKVNADSPILAYSGRLDSQKGLDLLMEVLPDVISEYNAQFVVIGTGDNKYRVFFEQLSKQFPGSVGTHLMSNFTLPRKVFAGCDILLLPSKFEPGGIVVIEGMRYGAVPVVRATGGLADIVDDFDPNLNSGNGFVFHNYTKLSLFGAIVRAIQVYRNQKVWTELVRKVMKEDFSWEKAAEQYIDLYERAIKFRRERQSPVQSIRMRLE